MIRGAPLESILDPRQRELVRDFRERNPDSADARAAREREAGQAAEATQVPPAMLEEFRESIVAEVQAFRQEVLSLAEAAQELKEAEALEISAEEVNNEMAETIVLTDDEKEALEKHRADRDSRHRELDAKVIEEENIRKAAEAAMDVKGRPLTNEETAALSKRIATVLSESGIRP